MRECCTYVKAGLALGVLKTTRTRRRLRQRTAASILLTTWNVVTCRCVERRESVSNRRDRANDPPLLILTSLSSGAKHGHALLLDIESFAGVRLGPGTLYGAITRLERRGLIEPLGVDERRRPYSITAAGSEFLAVALSELSRVVDEGLARLRRAEPRGLPCGAPIAKPAGQTA